MFIAMIFIIYLFIFCVLMPLSAIFQLYHGDQFQWWKKPEYPERNTDHGQTTGKLYHLRLRVECTLFCELRCSGRVSSRDTCRVNLVTNPVISHERGKDQELEEVFTTSGTYAWSFVKTISNVQDRVL